jgi:hypothetical protein
VKEIISLDFLLALAAALCSFQIAARAQTAEPKNVEIGVEQRVRNENWNNLFDFNDALDDQRNQVRYRTRFWAKVPVTSKIDLVAGLTQETNQIVVQRCPWRFDEVIFETAYLDFRDLFVKGLSLRVGRQNLMRGEGALIMEGNPWDGSRTIYDNAAVLAYAWKKSKIELIGISNPSRDRYLPRFSDRHRLLTEWDDQAIGSYFTSAPRRDTDVEAYYFYKKEVRDTRASSNPQFQPDRHVSTAGGRLVRRLPHGFTATGEGALQWGGDHAGREIRAWNAFGHVKRSFDRPGKPYVLGGYWAFSGDDPKTGNRIEGYDPLFGRFPKWSELYLYSLMKEKGVGYWTNMNMLQAETGFSPWKPMNWRFTYYHMGAYHPFAGDARIFAAGTKRGDSVQTRLDFTINPSWRGHVLYESFLPGNFYHAGHASYFLRFEMIYQFKKLIPI